MGGMDVDRARRCLLGCAGLLIAGESITQVTGLGRWEGGVLIVDAGGASTSFDPELVAWVVEGLDVKELAEGR